MISAEALSAAEIHNISTSIITQQKQSKVERRRGHNLVCASTKQFINTTFLWEKSGEFSKVSEVISQTGFGTWLIAFWKTLKPPELQQS